LLLAAGSARVVARDGSDAEAASRRAAWEGALRAIRDVDAEAVARDALARIDARNGAARGEAIAAALRRARIAALRRAKEGQTLISGRGGANRRDVDRE
jgi:hypothetical protein